jgi:hypothetical protein
VPRPQTTPRIRLPPVNGHDLTFETMDTGPQKEDEFAAACVPRKIKKRGQNSAALNAICGHPLAMSIIFAKGRSWAHQHRNGMALGLGWAGPGLGLPWAVRAAVCLSLCWVGTRLHWAGLGWTWGGLSLGSNVPVVGCTCGACPWFGMSLGSAGPGGCPCFRCPWAVLAPAWSVPPLG